MRKGTGDASRQGNEDQRLIGEIPTGSPGADLETIARYSSKYADGFDACFAALVRVDVSGLPRAEVLEAVVQLAEAAKSASAALSLFAYAQGHAEGAELFEPFLNTKYSVEIMAERLAASSAGVPALLGPISAFASPLHGLGAPVTAEHGENCVGAGRLEARIGGLVPLG